MGRSAVGRRGRGKVRVSPGTSPGTLSIDPDAPKPDVRVITYGADVFAEHASVSPEDLRELRAQGRVVWVDVAGLGDAGVIARIGEEFGLHRLALEDVVNVTQRPKVESYADHLFVVLRMSMGGEVLHGEQVSMFLGEGFVVTFQETRGDCFEPVRQRIRAGRPRLRSGGADYLCYALIDAVVDNYFPILERYGELLETLQAEALSAEDATTRERIFQVRKDLFTIRRAVWPLRDSLSSLVREDGPLITADTRIYLRDCHDHAIQVIDLVESCRETASTLMDLYLSSINNRMSEVMRVLTIFAAMFIPLTLIAGIYGMNFNPQASPLNMPELDWVWGYPFALALMLLTAGGMLFFFRRKGWLG